jgi:hypothetical protein
MIYLYAFCDQPDDPIPNIPWDKTNENQFIELSIKKFQDLAAVYSYTSKSFLKPDSENIWHHEMVVEALMLNRTVLPARFGTVLDNENSLHMKLEKLYPALKSNLQHLSGKVEVSLSVLWTGSDIGSLFPKKKEIINEVEPPQTGIEYMQTKLIKHQRDNSFRNKAEQILARLNTSLTQFEYEEKHQLNTSQGILVKASYLIKRKQLEEFQKTINQFSENRDQNQDLKFLLTGPWPPYSFISDLTVIK